MNDKYLQDMDSSSVLPSNIEIEFMFIDFLTENMPVYSNFTCPTSVHDSRPNFVQLALDCIHGAIQAKMLYLTKLLIPASGCKIPASDFILLSEHKHN